MLRGMAIGSGHREAGTLERVGVAAPPPLIEAKLSAPGVRGGMVDRPRLWTGQAAGVDAALTLVAAPAGYGKTTAVRAWCASQDAALAWVTLDTEDNDPTRLWRYVATAVDRLRPGLGRGALQRLEVPGCAIEDAVDELMNGIAAFGERLLLVLDDLHAVTDEACIASIDRALSHLPRNGRVILVTRVDPALSLARYRAAGLLVELRAKELAFTRAETHELLVTRGKIELGADEIDLLEEQTEGWPATLVLAGLWLRTVDDPTAAVRAFGGDQRFVAEYLSSEVLAALDEDQRSFLHGAAVLREFTPALCDAALDRTGSSAVLAELERSNLLLSRLERGGWFRIHSLFAAYARTELAASEPAAATTIQRRAAEWLRSQGLPMEALRHAAAAGDHEFVAEVLVDYHLSLMRGGEGGTFLRWVRTLPDDCLLEHPELAATAGVAAVLAGEGAIELRRFIQLADRAQSRQHGQSDEYSEIWVRIGRAATIDGGVGRAVLDGRRAVELAQAGSHEILTGALAAYARALFFAGDLQAAAAAASQVLEHPDIGQRPSTLIVARSTLALVAAGRGQLVAARRHAEAARAIAGRIGSSRSWLGANAAAALGTVLAAEEKFAEAEHELVTAERFFADEVATVHHTWLLVLLARCRLRRGRLDEAQSVLRSAREALDELTDSGVVGPLCGDVERELEMARERAAGGELLEAPTAAELAVLRLLASDLSAREMGEQLFLSPNTIRSHIRAIYRKLGVHSRPDAVARATALGLVEQARSPK